MMSFGNSSVHVPVGKNILVHDKKLDMNIKYA